MSESLPDPKSTLRVDNPASNGSASSNSVVGESQQQSLPVGNDNNNNNPSTKENVVVQQSSPLLMEEIEKEIRETQVLTSNKLEVAKLRDAYEKDSNFDRGVVYLQQHYRNLRRVRGDGNCYYRAFLYSLCDHLNHPNQEQELKRITSLIKSSMDRLETLGYERFAIETFWEEMVELLESLPKDDFHTQLNAENATSDYCTWYMRVLTAAHLKSDADRFVHFMEGNYPDMVTFCQREVEPMGKECGMLQVLALSETLQVRVEIEYLDGHDFGNQLTKHSFGPDQGLTLTFLYRPGHYDILYK